MKKIIILTIIILSHSLQIFAQWGSIQRAVEQKTERHFRKKGEAIGEKHAQEGINKGAEAAIEGIDKLTQWEDEQLADEKTFIDTNFIEYSEIQWQKLRFVPGNKIIFFDKPFPYEKDETEPENFFLKQKSRGKTQIIHIDEGSAIVVSADGYLIPKINNPEKDYLPDNFTIEFDFNTTITPFSKPIYLFLFDKEHQNGTGLKPIIINRNKVTYNDKKGIYPVADNDENGMSSWFHFAMSFNKGLIQVFLNERLMFATIDSTINPTGMSLEYMAYAPIMFKNIMISSGNQKPLIERLNNGKLISYHIDYNTGKQKLDGISVSLLSKIAKILNENPDIKLDIEVYFSQFDNEKENKKYGLEKAGAIDKVLTAMNVNPEQITVNYKGSYKTSSGDINNKISESVIFIKK
jgi:hypothetical protein